MVDSVNYDAAMESITAEIEAYCEAQGIDPDDFLANLDSASTASLYDNPTFEAYFQLCYMQLMELLYPEVYYSAEGDTGSIDFDTLYAAADEDMNELIYELIEDDPELMAYYALQEGGQSEADAFMDLLDSYYATLNEDGTEDDGISDAIQEAYDLAEEYGLGGVAALADKELMFESAQNSILDMLEEYDAGITALVEALNAGEISETEFEAEMSTISYYRETMLAMLQQLTTQEMTYFEAISELYSKATEMDMAIINKFQSF